MNQPNIKNCVIQSITFSGIQRKDIQLFIKREDLIHPEISGNKYRKLKFNIAQAKKEGKNTLLTFGGAYSNHIAATAAAGKQEGLKTIGVIRGEELGVDLENTIASNSTLRFAKDCGMQFHFVSRTDYRNKTTDEFINDLKNQFGEFYLVPEGGTNEFAVKGCEEILSKETEDFDTICVAVGTGGTISGLINSTENHQQIIGFPALKGDFLPDEIQKYTQSKNWLLNCEYHFGGYAKITDELIRFINQFKKETGIPLDPIYTGKMLFGIVDLINSNYFSEGTKILAIHTGGLQGIEGVNAILKKRNSLLIE